MKGTPTVYNLDSSKTYMMVSASVLLYLSEPLRNSIFVSGLELKFSCFASLSDDLVFVYLSDNLSDLYRFRLRRED